MSVTCPSRQPSSPTSPPPNSPTGLCSSSPASWLPTLHPVPSWPGLSCPAAWPKALLALLAPLLELAVLGLLAYGTAHYFGLEVDWEQRTIHARTSECQLGARGQGLDWAALSFHTPLPSTAFTFHQFSQWLKMVTLPTMWLGGASLSWELLSALWRYLQGLGEGGKGRL